jgi:branched-chain amino acid aminotransferase
MNELQAYLNGQWIPASAAAVSAVDAGFVLGVTVAEQLRTFAGRIFRLEEHLDRLEHSLQIIGLTPPLIRRQSMEIAQKLIDINQQLLKPGDDWGVTIFVTPGLYASYSPAECGQPTVCFHAYPLPFCLWAEKYRRGQALVTTEIQQVPGQCWPAVLKCRSRMHYYLADKLAREKDPSARAVLLDGEGHVTEASTANVAIYRKTEGLISPPRKKILPGISLATAFQLAEGLGISCFERELTAADLTAADEIILTSTPMCLLPVTRFNGRPVGSGRPGEISCRLLASWSEMAGVDIVGQAEKFARR